MFNSETLTIYNFCENPDKSKSCYRHHLYNNHVDEKRRTSFLKTGQKVLHTAYISIKDVDKYVPYKDWVKLSAEDKALFYTLKTGDLDLIVMGYSEEVIQTSTLALMQADIAAVKANFKTYGVGEFDTKFHGSRKLWHIEVGGI